MAFIEYNVSEAVGTTEHSFTFDATYSSASLKTDEGMMQAQLDVADMVTGDEVQIRVYKKLSSGGSVLLAYQTNLVGPQNPPVFMLPGIFVKHGFDVTCDAIAGTITINGSVLVAPV